MAKGSRLATSLRTAALGAAILMTFGCGDDAPQPNVNASANSDTSHTIAPPSTVNPPSVDTPADEMPRGATTEPQPDPTRDENPIQTEVAAALQADGRVNVLVSLSAPADPGKIASAADRVLADLDKATFQIRLRFEAVPAIAGTVTDASALEVLDSHPDVIYVSLDPSGTGAGAGGG